MLFKLSLNNIRRSIRDYAVYFFTIVIGVAIFYLFNSIEEQEAFRKFKSHAPDDINDMISATLRGLSGFVSVVLGLLIVYASRFLMKRRGKEFAIYLMLGMGKRKVSAILFVETLLIGIGSLCVGLLLGVGLSQLMSALVADLFEADLDSYKFILSCKAAKMAAIYFGISYIVVMLFNGLMIGKCKLIDLIQTGRKAEKLHLKSPWLCVVIFAAASAMLIYAYRTVLDFNSLSGKMLLVCIVLGAVSTLLIFWSVSGLILRIVMSFRRGYYKGLNCFTFRQISSKMNTMVVSMTVICLILFGTICAISISLAFRDALNKEFKECCPADMELVITNKAYISDDNKNKDKYIRETPEEIMEKAGLSDIFSETSVINMYAQRKDEENIVYIDDLLGSHIDEYYDQKDTLYMIENLDKVKTMVVSIEDFNKMWELFGREPLSIGRDEYFVLSDEKIIRPYLDKAAADGQEINFAGHKLTPAFDESVYGAVDMTSNHINPGILIVDGSVLEGREPMMRAFHGNYKADSKEEKRAVDEDMRDKVFEFIKDNYTDKKEELFGMSYFTTKVGISDMTIGLGAMVTFIGLYLGLIFLITCAAIIALKQLSDSVDSVERYEMLRKVGAEEKSISCSLFIQTGTVFLLPLLLAVIHSVYGIRFAKPLMIGLFASQRMMSSIIATAAMVVFIYGGYFVITYLCSRSIIRSRRK